MKKLIASSALPLALLTACGGISSHSASRPPARGFAAAPAVVPVGAVIKQPGFGSMSVTKVECGQKSLRYAASKDGRSGAGVVRPTSGHQICIVMATFMNTEATSLEPAPFASLVTAGGQAYSEDAPLSELMSWRAPDHPVTSRLNSPVAPGQATAFRAYFEIPDTTKATSIAWPGTSEGQTQTFLLG